MRVHSLTWEEQLRLGIAPSPKGAPVAEQTRPSILHASNTERGLRSIREAIETKPTAAELHDLLILSLVWLGCIEEAGAAAEANLGATERPAAVDFLCAANLGQSKKLAAGRCGPTSRS
jgi:hypothetical protein